MTLEILTPEELERVYETELREAFPPSELKPLHAMEQLRAAGAYEPLCLRDGGGELGYILLWRHSGGRFLLIDYLCVPAERRGGGLGGQLLRAAFSRYPDDAVFIAESEAPTGDPIADGTVHRRLAFYRRSGARPLGYDCALFGVHYRTLCWGRAPLPDEAVILRRHREIYLERSGLEKYRRFIQIPLAPGEKPFPVRDWTED